MDTKEYAERIRDNLDDYSFECGYVAEEYLTQCEEIERLKKDVDRVIGSMATVAKQARNQAFEEVSRWLKLQYCELDERYSLEFQQGFDHAGERFDDEFLKDTP